MPLLSFLFTWNKEERFWGLLLTFLFYGLLPLNFCFLSKETENFSYSKGILVLLFLMKDVKGINLSNPLFLEESFFFLSSLHP